MTSALPASDNAAREPRRASAGFPGLLGALIEAMRPAQWQKNLLLFAAFIFSSGKAWTLGEPASWLPLLASSAGGFALFSLAASGGYLLNDVVDVERDRAHPRKRYRPIASGRLPVRVAAAAGATLLGGSVLAGLLLDVRFGFVLLAYVGLTASYSFALKQFAIIDAMAVAMGFTLRAVAGAFVIHVPITVWLYVVTTFGALFLATLRRRQEWLLVRDQGVAGRAVIGQYSGEFLEQMTGLAMNSTVISYAMYVTTADNLPPDHSMLITLPFVVYGLLRFRFIADRQPERNIDEMLLRDRLSMLNIAAFGACALGVLAAAR